MTTIIDYGIGNLRSLAKAFAAAGVPVRRTDDPDLIAQSERLVLPGVGAFGACASEIQRRGLRDLVRQRAAEGVPLLGVCVGMQLLFEASEERGEHEGLGLLQGRVVRFTEDLTDATGQRLKVPHMGWNQLDVVGTHPVLPAGAPWVYFVHSYHAQPGDSDDLLATATHGTAIPAVVGRHNVVGMQFHPEKSGQAGLSMLRRFASWMPVPSPV
ncbi:MAG: imidazole glycerol phosphate synthase subunit HisH [Bacteroidota bacterium]